MLEKQLRPKEICNILRYSEKFSALMEIKKVFVVVVMNAGGGKTG